jgi:hypothetical protein
MVKYIARPAGGASTAAAGTYAADSAMGANFSLIFDFKTHPEGSGWSHRRPGEGSFWEGRASATSSRTPYYRRFFVGEGSALPLLLVTAP